MKLEAVNKLPQFKQKPRRVQDVSKYTDEELSEFIDEVKNIKSNIKYPTGLTRRFKVKIASPHLTEVGNIPRQKNLRSSQLNWSGVNPRGCSEWSC